MYFKMTYIYPNSQKGLMLSYSYSSLSYDSSENCSKSSSSHSAIQSFLLLMRVSSPFLNPLNAKLNPICHLLALLGVHHFLHVSRIRVKVIQQLPTSSSSSSCHFYPPFYLSFNNQLLFKHYPINSSSDIFCWYQAPIAT